MIAEAQLHAFTVDEFYRIVEAGMLPDDRRFELLDGAIYEMPAGSKPPHAVVITRLTTIFGDSHRGRYFQRVQLGFVLDDFNAFIPDFTLVRPSESEYTGAHPQPGDALLVVEVSDSSLVRDSVAKLRVYALDRVAEYWIADIPNRALRVHRDPRGDGFAAVSVHADGVVTPAAFPDITVDITALFRGL